jgi:hypothetical protein
LLLAAPVVASAFGREAKKHQGDQEADDPHAILTSHASFSAFHRSVI